jgi:3-oxoadipate enol-lactonase
LLIMGFGMRGAVWRPQVDALRRDHRVVFYDHLGVGESDDLPGFALLRAIAKRTPRAVHPTIASMADDALRVLDAVGWTDAHIVGVSMGGMIAQELTLRAPERVRSLTLIATHAGGVRSALPRAEGLRRFAQANFGPRAARIAALKRLLYTPEFLARAGLDKMDQRFMEMAGKRAPQRTVLGHLGAVLRHRTRDRLGAIHAPTLVLRPGRDILVHPRNSDVIARAIPHARVVRFEDAGHGVTFQCAKGVNEEIARHVAEAEAEARS